MPSFHSRNELLGAARQTFGALLTAERNRTWQRGRILTAIVAVFLLSTVPSVATAEPITFTYRIDRCDVPNCQQLLSFPLRLTIESESPPGIYGYYGPAKFSDIPLFPTMPTDVMTVSFAQLSFDGGDENGLELWRVNAKALNELETADGFWTTELWGSRDFPVTPIPKFSAELFALILGNGFFEYSFSEFRGSETGVSYRGTATLIDAPSPVPEPASLLLVGTGLSALAARHWRNRRQIRNR